LLVVTLKKLNMRLTRYLVERFPDESQLSALRAKAAIAVGAPNPKKDMPIAAEKFRRAHQEQLNRALTYDQKGLRLLEAHVQGQHELGITPTASNIEGPGAFHIQSTHTPHESPTQVS
jgi:hypothetical protein